MCEKLVGNRHFSKRKRQVELFDLNSISVGASESCVYSATLQIIEKMSRALTKPDSEEAENHDFHEEQKTIQSNCCALLLSYGIITRRAFSKLRA